MTGSRARERRYERGHSPAIGEVAFAEASDHPALLDAKLGRKRDQRDENGEQARPLATGQRRTGERNEESRVDGMADQGIGAAVDEFVILMARRGASARRRVRGARLP